MVRKHHQLNGYEYEQTPGDSKGQEAWGGAVHGVAKSWTWPSDWTTTHKIINTIPTTLRENRK